MNDSDDLDFNDISLESLNTHLLFGDVDTENVKNAVEFVIKSNILFKKTQELTIFLNTIGGDCYEGFALIDIIEASKHPIKIIGLGNILSMGVLLLSAGHKGKRTILKNTQVMAHQFWYHNGGKFHELLAAHKSELYLESQFIRHFLHHTKMSENQIRDIVFSPSDRWLTPAECKKYGIVDHVLDELPDLSHHEPVQPVKSKNRSR